MPEGVCPIGWSYKEDWVNHPEDPIEFHPPIEFTGFPGNGSGPMSSFLQEVKRDYEARRKNVSNPEAESAAITGVLQDWWNKGWILVKEEPKPVATVRALPTFKGEVHESVVKQLKAALKAAEEGELADVVIVGAYTAGEFYLASSKTDRRFARLGMMHFAIHLMMKEVAEEWTR